MQIRNFTAGMPAGMTGRIRGLVLRSQKFLKEQGGMLCFYNHAESGAEVVCRIKTEKT